jgi:hypothetical protein
VRITGVRAEIRTGHLPDISIHIYRSGNVFVYKLDEYNTMNVEASFYPETLVNAYQTKTVISNKPVT